MAEIALRQLWLALRPHWLALRPPWLALIPPVCPSDPSGWPSDPSREQMDGRIDGQIDRIFPPFTGLCPLSGPLPKKGNIPLRKYITHLLPRRPP